MGATHLGIQFRIPLTIDRKHAIGDWVLGAMYSEDCAKSPSLTLLGNVRSAMVVAVFQL